MNVESLEGLGLDLAMITETAAHRQQLLDDCEQMAEICGNMFQSGRYCGYKLRFLDGHQCEMTFAEMRRGKEENDVD